MKRPVLLLGFLYVLLACGLAGGETLPRQTFAMTFEGFTEDTARGIEEYIVEFPGYAGHQLVRQGLAGNEYRYETAENPDGIAASLRRMFAFLDVEGRIDIDGMQITVTHSDYIGPAMAKLEPSSQPESEPEVALLPPPPPPPNPRLRLWLSTARGDAPVFTIGETFDLTVKLSGDAWLYCYYRQVDGRVVKFFPNPHHEGAWVKGGREHRIPGAIYPSDLVFTEPPGSELLTCFATRRDVAADLPAALRIADLAALPPEMDSRLDKLFAGLTNAEVARATLPITVTR